MSRGYGKSYRKGYSHASFQFDKLFKENSNRPSAARSAGTVGKWGITSFTSIRSSNGLSGSQYPEVTTTTKRSSKYEDPAPNVVKTKKDPFCFDQTSSGLSEKNNTANIVKPKKFFKSRDTQVQQNKDEPKMCSSDINTYSPPPNKKLKTGGNKKFFHSKRSPSPKARDESKPPIVLRICRGKSRLLSDSDESESVTTPTNATSPQPTRITRSTRRSMQQDSPVLETPAETPFASLMTPEYIAPEKFELERKAMYENLLGLSSPVEPQAPLPIEQEKVVVEEEEKEDTVQVEDPPENIIATTPEAGGNEDPTPKSDETHEENAIITNTPVEEDENVLSTSDLTTPPKSQETTTITEPKEPDVTPAAEPIETQSDSDDDDIFCAVTVPIKRIQTEYSSSDSDSELTTTPGGFIIPPHPPQPNTIDQHRDEILDKILEKPTEEAPVKLVISKKKGSIFKSRSMVTDGSKKRHALYKHKWSEDGGQKSSADATETERRKEPVDPLQFEEYDFGPAPYIKFTRTVENDLALEPETVTGVHCAKSDKNYYTVVRNVKKAHQIQEIGEFQEFNDDVEYILDTLQDHNPTGTRCLSAIRLATKCMAPAFRMHVRAHGIVAKFFRALHDAAKDQSLGLCTATVMFVLSQDRLNMDLDRDCLELMLNLLESDVSYQKALDDCGLFYGQLYKNKMKVRELCEAIKDQNHAMVLNLDNITVGQLAMETLLSLTSKRAGEWFKEELRELGGLQHIMETICECCRQVSDYVVVWTDKLLDKLRKVDRCMRVLENVTQNNQTNQTYILEYNNGVILDTLVKLYRLCDSEIPLYPVTDILDKESTGTIIREALLVTLKVLINLTHHFSKKSMGSALIGAKPGIVDASLHLLLQIPHYIPEQKKFELGVLVLMLLINLMQDNENNKKLLVNAKAPADFESIYPCDKSALEALITQFYKCDESARMAEKRTNAILDGEKDHTEQKSQPKSHEQFIEETVAILLQKAGTHMEFTFLASYIVMVIGFLIKDNPDYESKVRIFLKGHTFKDMVVILKKFFCFMNLTASTEASNVEQIKDTEALIKFMEDCDKNSVTSENETTTVATS